MGTKPIDRDLCKPMRDDGLPDVPRPCAMNADNLEILESKDRSVATFVWTNESHTLGNALRHVLLHNPKVSFAGYTVPHPLENTMKLHLRTVSADNPDETPVVASDVLVEGLGELARVMETTLNMFDQAMEVFQKENPTAAAGEQSKHT
eukprot:RCo051027